MNSKERLKKALKALGPKVKAKVIKAKGPKKSKSKKPRRKISSLIPGKCKQNVSAKEIYRQCAKKVRYKSQHEARVIANLAESQRGHKLRVYCCPICNGWHLTSHSNKPFKKA